ncbi:hypothetical protein ACIQZI_20250 [Peribacillus sp. NPDC096379]
MEPIKKKNFLFFMIVFVAAALVIMYVFSLLIIEIMQAVFI